MRRPKTICAIQRRPCADQKLFAPYKEDHAPTTKLFAPYKEDHAPITKLFAPYKKDQILYQKTQVLYSVGEYGSDY